MTPDRKLRVFLCHASQDKPIVRELYQRLNAEGWIDPWLDEEKLLPGQDWDLEITNAMFDADAVIVALSSISVSREGYVRKEINNVLEQLKQKPEDSNYFIPVRLDECKVPPRLQQWQYVDFFPSKRTDWAYARILDSLKLRAEIKGIVSNRVKDVKTTQVSSSEKEVPEIIPLSDRLSELEFEVLALIGEGLTQREIAKRLKRTIKDIKSTNRATREKLNARTISQIYRLIYLTRRELEVLYLFGTDISIREIANKLGISLSTVRSHTYSVREKLGVKSTLEALDIVKKHTLF